MPDFTLRSTRPNFDVGFSGEKIMATCETCGNDYEDSFRIILKDRSYDFDSFECAIHALAPACEHCGCRVLGHGVQFDDTIFCCVHCAVAAGATGLTDHAQTHIIAGAM